MCIWDSLKNIQLVGYFFKAYHYKGKVEIREGSPTGTLLGTATIDLLDKTKGKEQIYPFKLQSSTTVGDLVVVFKNSTDAEQKVMNLDQVVLGY